MMNSKTSFPFTATQWQELEHQALIFKYMVSGIPIPPDLLFAIKQSFNSSLISSKLIPRQPNHIGWNYFPLNSGRKLDPEPGRCRRTDGKKWRCSKEVFPDSKYCERHMHRGKNRSRKPVENYIPTVLSVSKNTNPSRIEANSHSFSTISSVSSDTHFHHPFVYPHGSAASRTQTIGFSHEDNTTNLLLNSGSYSQTNSDYRYIYGLKEEVDEHAFFSEQSGTIKAFSSSPMDDSWDLAPLTISSSSSSSSSSSKQRSSSGLQSDYPYLQLQNLTEESKQQNQDHLSFGLCNDFGIKIDRQPQKTIHFFDEWPPKNRSSSWLDVEDKSSTQLSISIPTSSLDFPIFNSRSHNDG